MMQLSALVLAMMAVFGYIGYTRGWNKEIIATAGIILGVFALFQFDDIIRQNLLANTPPDQVFIVQATLFSIVVFFAYQDRTPKEDRKGQDNDPLQTSVLGGLTGMLNGYMIWGTLWYLMDINNYPLAPYIIPPQPGTANANTIEQIRALIEGGAGGGGEPLTIAVIILFLIVLIVI